MIFSSNKIIKIIKKNIEITFLFLLLLITILSTSIYNEKKVLIDENYKNLINNIYFQKSINQIFDNLVPRYKNIDHKISSGETFDKILNNYSIPNEEINQIKKKLNSDYNINNLQPNLEIKITIDQSNNKKITSFLFPVSRTEKIQLTRNLDNNLFEKKTIITNLNKKIVFKEGKITQSLYKTAIDLKVQPNVIIEFARIYGFQVDFQRDIRKNDNFQIMYEVFEDDDGKIFETGNIIFADLKLSGKNNALYYFEKKGSEGHYDENGKSVEKALMKTPINGARLSSAFGMRKHPIDGFNKMHRGTDFAAPMGTPIMASGSGLITRARWCGGGGNCIKIKHNSTYETIYAHMKNFARGIKEGIRVKQGQIIGYVGSTGKSTGPHLHYEVVVNGKKVNSQKLKLPSGKTLKGKEREIFEVEKIKLDVLKSELIIG
ncbi:peptidoglycan DD-metalloendopeptidase family protein [Candidatus Pelagibacter bacterium]|nr:peptidoglycan DD-metalloendopeptidase family protein [Candidatus Pelagibacter bacterium]MDA7485780.1 peptidoglycan DD-metalloendopeptidase family protein [Candidatus Pelagibacter ubique]MDB2708840.1 peptidoglycan DD-metalloendopeptidase family protein [Candidatus Pelagibacter bacterium]MDC1185261.1 peptidoglycan DD-metalloendopeptidase family protein [Candidatus Pelagibacter ubique]